MQREACRRLSSQRPLIAVNWSVNLHACVQRSTCISCRISSHANPALPIVQAEIDLPLHGLLAWSTKLVDGRPRVLHLRSLAVRWRRRPSEYHVYYPHNWHKIGCHGNVPRGIEKLTPDR